MFSIFKIAKKKLRPIRFIKIISTNQIKENMSAILFSWKPFFNIEPWKTTVTGVNKVLLCYYYYYYIIFN